MDMNAFSDDRGFLGAATCFADLVRPSRRMRAPPSETIVLWVFRDTEDHWCVREEGGSTECFASRERAVEYARQTGRLWGSYRMFLELKDGRVTQELFNLDRQ